MKVTSKIEKVEKVVEVEEKIITMEMSVREAKRLKCILGSLSVNDWKTVCGSNSFKNILDFDDNPIEWTHKEVDGYFNNLEEALYES